jgi:hypothetical protein
MLLERVDDMIGDSVTLVLGQGLHSLLPLSVKSGLAIKKEPQAVYRLGVLRFCLNSGWTERRGCRGMGVPPGSTSLFRYVADCTAATRASRVSVPRGHRRRTLEMARLHKRYEAKAI